MEERKVLDLDSRLDLYCRLEKICKYVNTLLQQMGEKKTWVGVTFGILSQGETFPPERINLKITEKVNQKSPTGYDYEFRKVAVCFPRLKEAKAILWFVTELLQVLAKHSQEKN